MTALQQQPLIYAGIDTHAHTHHVALIDGTGRKLGDAQFPTTAAGYEAVVGFITRQGVPERIGMEGTGSYGASLTRHLYAAGLQVREVIRPNRQQQRLKGKSDPLDAYSAAQTVLADPDLPLAKTRDGYAAATGALLMARESMMNYRTRVFLQIRDLLVSAPERIRARFRGLSDKRLVAAVVTSRVGNTVLENGVMCALKGLARTHQDLSEKMQGLEREIAVLVREATPPALLSAVGIGVMNAARLLVTFGDNPERITSEAAFASLCGAAPVPASSGVTVRYRLSRGGDRQANRALHNIAVTRMQYCEETRRYAEKKLAEGKSLKDVLRRLKRAIAREVWGHFMNPKPVPDVSDLRVTRQEKRVTLVRAGAAMGTHATKIARIEKSEARDDKLVGRYREWLQMI